MTDETMFFFVAMAARLSYDREIRVDGGSHNGGFMSQYGPEEAET